MQMYKTASELYVIYNRDSEGTKGLNMAFHDISEEFRGSDSNPYIEIGWKMADLYDDDLYHRFEGDKYMISDDINSFDWDLSIDPSYLTSENNKIDYETTLDKYEKLKKDLHAIANCEVFINIHEEIGRAHV